jgi:hypothetical protein
MTYVSLLWSYIRCSIIHNTRRALSKTDTLMFLPFCLATPCLFVSLFGHFDLYEFRFVCTTTALVYFSCKHMVIVLFSINTSLFCSRPQRIPFYLSEVSIHFLPFCINLKLTRLYLETEINCNRYITREFPFISLRN